MHAKRPLTDLLDAPRRGKRISQLLYGEAFTVEKTEAGHSFGHMDCGYQGWVDSAALAKSGIPRHYVSAMGTFVYTKPDMKSELRLRLPFRAKVRVLGTDGPFSRLLDGYVFSAHLGQGPMPDFVATAERFLGVPYLWGGRSSLGIDCSGLAQMALHAAGLEAPRDSGPQAAGLGESLPLDAPLQRGDFVFWPGHVGLMQDATTLLHATAFSMAVMSEPLATTVTRSRAQGNGEITAIRRDQSKGEAAS